MNLFLPTILKVFPKWNERIYATQEIRDVVYKHGGKIVETDLIDGPGEYRLHRDKYPTILINKFLAKNWFKWVLAHETTHLILHPTAYAKFSDTDLRRKIEKEANFVAGGLLIPKHIVETKKVWEIEDEYGYPRLLINIRKDNYESHRK